MNDEPLPEVVYVARIDGVLRFNEHWQFFINTEGKHQLVAEYRLVGLGKAVGSGREPPKLRVVKGFNP